MSNYTHLNNIAVQGSIESSAQGKLIGSFDTMPAATALNSGQIVLYIGPTGTYTKGKFYVSNGTSWVLSDASPSSITIDSALSSTSTNPVQNKVVAAALNGKVDTVSGKGLSTNDYTAPEKNKLAGIAAGAQVNVIEEVQLNGTKITPSSKAVNIDLSGYATKGDVSAIPKFAISVVTSLPTSGISTSTIYLKSNGGSSGNSYDEYIYVNNAWEKIGTTEVDLSGYVPTSRTVNGKALTGNITLAASDVGALATGGTAAKATADASGNNIVNTYATKTELTNGLAGKQATLTFDSAPTSGSSNPVTSGGVFSAIKNETVSKSEYQDLVDRIGTMDTITSKTYPYHKTFVLNATIPAISQTSISTKPSDDYRAITSLDSFTVKKVTETERCWIDGKGWVDAGIEFDKSANYPKIAKDISTAKGSAGDIVMYGTSKMYSPIKDALKTLIGQSLEVVTDDGVKLVPRGNITLHVSISKLRGNIYWGTSSSTSNHTILHENVGITSTLMNKDFEGLDISVADNKITAIPDIGNIYQTYKGAESGKYYSFSTEQQTVQITATITVDDVKLVGNVYPLSKKVGKLTFNFPSGFIDISELNLQFSSMYNSSAGAYHIIRTTGTSKNGSYTSVNLSYTNGDLNIIAICPEIAVPPCSYSNKSNNTYYPRNDNDWIKEMLTYYFKKNLIKSGDTSNVNCKITIGPLYCVARTSSNSDYENIDFENFSSIPEPNVEITIVKGDIKDVSVPKNGNSIYTGLFGANQNSWTKFTKFYVGAYGDITVTVT